MILPQPVKHSGAIARRVDYAFYALGAGCILVAAALRSSLIQRFAPAQAGPYLPDLLAGVQLVRAALVLAALLCAVTPWLLRRDRPAAFERLFPKLDANDWMAIAAIFGAALALRALRLNDSFWWDELTTYLRSVRRGLPVIFAFSSEGNNHPLNSFLMWIVYAGGGRKEWMLRLPALLLGAATPAIVYGLLRRSIPRWAALSAAGVMVLHFRAVAHSAEARGYAGAILCSAIAFLLFPRLFEGLSWKVLIGYVVACAAASGFIATALIIPMAHFLLAAAEWLRHRTRSLTPMLACVWAAVASLVLMGVTLPQLRTYSVRDSWASHQKLSVDLFLSILQYVAGVNVTALAIVLILLAAAGLWLLRESLLALACAFPGILYMLVVAVTGTRVSQRLFYMLIFPFALGLGLLLYDLVTRRGIALRLTACAVGIVWLLGAAGSFRQFYSVGNPPLQRISAEFPGDDLVLTGLQADVNVLYFPHARLVQSPDVPATILASHPRPSVLAGINCEHSAFPPMSSLGYTLQHRYNDSLDRICYLLYSPPAN